MPSPGSGIYQGRRGSSVFIYEARMKALHFDPGPVDGVFDQDTRYAVTTVQKYFACDPTVTSVQLFLLVDEKYRNGKDETGKTVGGGWQSGLLTAGGENVSTPKLAYSQVAPDFAAGRSA